MAEIIKEELLLSTNTFHFIKIECLRVLGCCAELAPDVNAFLDACKELNVFSVFYQYKYYDRYNYTITEDLLREYTENDREFTYCKNWAESYNAITEKLDYAKPSELILCASVGSFTMMCTLKDEWMECEEAAEALVAFQQEHEDELADLYEYRDVPSLVEEFRNLLLGDKVFRYCTNKADRSKYLERFMAKKENKKFWALAKGSKNEWERRDRINTIVNQIYNEYRNECHKLKIQVGEKL